MAYDRETETKAVEDSIGLLGWVMLVLTFGIAMTTVLINYAFASYDPVVLDMGVYAFFIAGSLFIVSSLIETVRRRGEIARALRSFAGPTGEAKRSD